ncbi:MAG: prepilin peptidase [Bacteroidales bacterium]|nr:prepilin peptidase [Bacteroidales bacterium]
MKVLAPVLISILLSLSFSIALLIYFNFDEIKKENQLLNKGKKIFNFKGRIKWTIIIVFISGIIFFLIAHLLYDKNIINALKWQLSIMIMIPIGDIDHKEQIIPNKLLLIGLIFTLPLLIIEIIVTEVVILSVILSSLLGAIVAGGIFFISSLIVKNGVGAGDIKMYFTLGLLVGFVGIFNVLLYSMVLSAIFGIVLIVSKKKKSKDSLPLAPFTLFGVILAILLGV